MKAALHVVADGALDVGYQATQAGHAIREFVALCPAEDAAWYRGSNTLVLHRTRRPDDLARLLVLAREKGVPAAPFYEPDLGGALTAVALAPSAWTERVCAPLPLLGAP